MVDQNMTPAGDAFVAALSRLTVRPDEEIDALQTNARKFDALKLIDRLPVWLRAWRTGRLDDCDTRLVAAAREWTPERGLVLMGPTGAGKSTAAAWLFHRLLAAGIRRGDSSWQRAQSLRWYGAIELERARQEHPLGKGDAPEILAASRASVLVLDDAGQDRQTKAVEDVVSARYEAKLVTIVTTNLTPDGLTGHYGAVTVRKLREVGGETALHVEAF